jgi:F0F1-type ATP synthase membrane subunit b/b'
MDDEMLTQLRTASFSEARKGFDKDEVRRFLAEVDRWIEGGGGDVVRRRLERIAHKSAQMLADAEDGAEGLRREADQEAREMRESAKAEAEAHRDEAEAEARAQLRDARAEASAAREAADRYVEETTTKADEYADQTRLEAKRESEELVDNAARQAKQTIRAAEQRADQLVAEATRQREAIETVIGDLIHERDAVVDNVRELSRELVETADSLVSKAEVSELRSAGAPDVEPPKLEAVESAEPEEEDDEEAVAAPRRNGSPAV